MSVETPKIAFDFEWEEAPGVTSPPLRSTWARLEIRIFDSIVTQVDDARSRSTRNAIFVPLYPLAEWIVYNWWLLLADVRPGYLPSHAWTVRAGRPLSARREWLLRHNMRGAGEGFPWPNLTFLPTPQAIHLAWARDTRPERGGLRYLSQGLARLEKSVVTESIGNLVEAVVERLNELSIPGTPLEEEWGVLRQTPAEEAEFCVTAARLGLDPYSVPESVADLILRASDRLEGPLLDDFLNAADPGLLEEDLDWIDATSALITSTSSHSRALPDLTLTELNVPKPWLTGYADAQQVRSKLDSPSTSRFSVEDWITIETTHAVDRGIEGLAGLNKSGGRVLAIDETRHAQTRRFAAGRALWRLLRGDEYRALLTVSRAEPQQAERAFAAELLAPASALTELLPVAGDVVLASELRDLADHFDVSEWVIEFQIVNNLGLDVEPTMTDAQAGDSAGAPL